MRSVYFRVKELRIKIRVVGKEPKVVELGGDRKKVSEMLRELGLLSEEYIVMKGRRVLTDEDVVADGDEVVLVPVVSGG